MPKSVPIAVLTTLLSFPGTAFADAPLYRRAYLDLMGLLHFGGPRSLDELGMKLMTLMGVTIIFFSLLGIMIGGLFLVFAGGNEGRAKKGKDVIVASIVGLIVTLSAYLIVTFIRDFVYAV